MDTRLFSSALGLAVGVAFMVALGVRASATPAEPVYTSHDSAGVQVAAGGRHTCALKADGSIVCWGEPFSGKLNPPVGFSAVQLSAGQNHTCALAADGTVACWGFNGAGQTNVPEGLVASQISAGVSHTCAVTADATAVCWGITGGPDDKGQTTVPDGLTSVEQVVAALEHSCALRMNSDVVCWGTNFNDQLNIPGGLSASEISGRYLHTCALRFDGTPACWGYHRIAAVPPDVVADRIIAGGTHTCAVQLDSTVRCWGFDAQLLPEDQADFGQTIVPPDLGPVVQLSTGHFHTCALRPDGTVVCWGRNVEGQTDVPEELTEPADSEPPAVICAAPDGAWHAADVSLFCTATDDGSGLANAADASFFLATNVAANTETANASTASHEVCDNAGNCATAGPIAGNMIDKRAPAVMIVSPTSTLYTIGQTVLASYSCPDGGSGAVSCAGPIANGLPIDTSVAGSFIFNVAATDAVGNSSSDFFSYDVSLGGMYSSITPATIWLGLKNSDDVGTKFDVLVEVLKNSTVVGSGQINAVPGGSSGFNNAVERAIAAALNSPTNYRSADTLGIRISVRIAVGVPGHASGTARLWYNDAAANSRIDTIVNGVARTFYLNAGSVLGLAPGTGPKATSDVLVKRAGGNPFKPLGTWTIVF